MEDKKIALSNGTVLKSQDGENVCILSFIARGGQGEVYRVKYDGNEYALKWYCINKEDVVGGEQYSNIKELCNSPSPSDRFVWPLKMVYKNTNPSNGEEFGYIMDLLPDHYYDLEKFLLGDDAHGKRSFKSYSAWLNVALDIVAAIRELHCTGFSYKDLQPKNFAVNDKNGDVLVVDNDNVSAQGGTVLGSAAYMAPEIPRSGYTKLPDQYTDFYSLAIILFKLFYIDHPMDGKRLNNYHVINDKVEEELYYLHPVYCFDPDNDSNRPDEIFTPNVYKRWDVLFTELHPLFERSFTEGINNPTKRITENQWMKKLSEIRDMLVKVNGREFFVDFSESSTLELPPLCLRLDVYANGVFSHYVALHPGNTLYENSITGVQLNYKKEYAVLGKNAQSGLVMIMNKSQDTWQVYDPHTNRKFTLSHGERMEIRPRFQIKFNERTLAKIVNPHRK